MPSLRIGVDLDGVVADFVSGLRNHLLATGKPSDSMPPPTCWEMWDDWGMTKEEWLDAFDKAAASGLFHQLAPYKGAVEALRELKEQGHSIHIVTHRDLPCAQTSTIGWLNEREIPYDSLTFSADKTAVPVDVFIEDNVDNARAIEAEGTPCHVMTRSWNESEVGLRHVNSWNEFLIRVDLLSRVGKEVYVGESSGPKAEKRMTSETGGQKGQKEEQHSLVPVESLAEVARVYAFGAKKYDRDNWRRGYEWHYSYDALQRHAQAFWGGETYDPESGLHHLAHAAFHCFTLIAFGGDLERYARYDDRQQST